MSIPIDITTTMKESAALRRHIEGRLQRLLRAHSDHVQGIRIRMVDANGPRHGPNDKVTSVHLLLRPAGRVFVQAAASTARDSANRAITRAKAALVRHVSRASEPAARRRVSQAPEAAIGGVSSAQT